jgi:hypothetical protein
VFTQQDFGQFMKDNRLAPVLDPAHLASFTGRPIDRGNTSDLILCRSVCWLRVTAV